MIRRTGSSIPLHAFICKKLLSYNSKTSFSFNHHLRCLFSTHNTWRSRSRSKINRRKGREDQDSRSTVKYTFNGIDSHSVDEHEHEHEHEDGDNIFADSAEGAVLNEYDSKELAALNKLMHYKPILPPNETVDKDDEDYIDKFDGIPDEDEDKEDYGPLESDPRQKLGRLLLSLGKIHYRHAESHSSGFIDRLNEICSYRSKAQIRRCLKDWMLRYDRDELNKYRLKELKWGHQVPAVDKIQQLHAYGPEETAAYAFYYMPSRYSLMKRVLSELKLLSPHFYPSRVLDFGCGPASAAYAIHELWGDDAAAGGGGGGGGATKYTGIDISQSMIDAAKIMTRNTIRDCIFYSSTAEAVKRMPLDQRYSLAIASYTLSELPNDLSRRVAVQLLFESLEVGGYLVVLEAGHPFGSHTTRTARQFVLDVFNNVDNKGRTTKPSITSFDTTTTTAKGKSSDRKASSMHPGLVDMLLPPPSGFTYEEIGAYVVSPCTHDQQCPMALGGWCSFSQKVFSGMIRKATEEKFSYVVIQKRPKVEHAKIASQGETTREAPTTLQSIDPSMTDEEKSILELVGSQLDGTPIINPRKAMVAKKKQQLRDRKAEEEQEKHAKYSSNAFKKWGIWLESQAYLYKYITDSRNPSKTRGVIQDSKIDPTPLQILERFVGMEKPDAQYVLDDLEEEFDWDNYAPPLYREEWGRIIRSPIKSKGHIVIDLCVPEGSIVRSSLSRSNMLQVPSLYTALRKTTWGGLFPVLSDSVERSPLSKKKDRGGVGRKSNSNRDEIVRIEQSSANREIMRDALWDAKNISFDSSNKYDRTEKREIGRNSKGHGPTQRSDRHNDRGGGEEEEDDDGTVEDVDKSTTYSDRRRKSSGLSTTLQRLKKNRQAKKDI